VNQTVYFHSEMAIGLRNSMIIEAYGGSSKEAEDKRKK
jgi:hypothetical protein